MEIKDTTGEPRSDSDIVEAIRALEITMVKDVLKIPPRLCVMLPTIMDLLKELLMLRGNKDGPEG
jgi:hypothetical protein